MNNDILILGKGFLGKRLQEELQCPVSTKRIETFDDVYALLAQYKPKVLINCIGHTGEGNVDGCEKAKDKTLAANTYIPILLAEVAIREKIKFIHISSGCLYHFEYGRTRPIKESQPTDYYDLFYSRTKIYAESMLEKLAKNNDILIVRIRVPLDTRPHQKNILTKLLTFNKIINAPNSTTYIPDFVKAISFLIKKNAKGTFNIALKGGVRYKDLLDTYNRFGEKHDFAVMSLKDLNLKRTKLILSTTKLEKTGFKVRTPEEILEECVKEYIKHS